MLKFIIFIIVLFILGSCNTSNKQINKQLNCLDSILEKNPIQVLDSLKKIDATKLSRADKAYYYLLEASGKDKGYIPLVDDSIFQISEQYYKNKQEHYNLARTQYYQARFLSKANKPEEAYKLFKEAESNLKKDPNYAPHILGLTYYQLARIQDLKKNIPEAFDYYQKALKIFHHEKDTLSEAYSLKQLALIYTNQQDTLNAKKHLLEALSLIDSPTNKSQKFTEAKAGIYSTMSVLYRNIENIPFALKYAKKSIQTFNTSNKKFPTAYYYNVISAFSLLSKIDSAKYYCKEMISKAQNQNELINFVNGYRILSNLEESQGNYQEACQLKNKFNQLKDSLNGLTNKNKYLEIEKKYNIAEKERLLYKAKNARLHTYITTCVIISVIAVFVIIFYYRHKRLKVKYNKLSEDVKHTEWGFSITKTLISANNSVYEELERILSRYRIDHINNELYLKFQEIFIKQKINYSARLLSILTNFDNSFINNFQKMFPDLNSDDVMIAAMFRHQWKPIDIAAVFHITTEAVRKRKSRLTHKISAKLKKPINLDEYLQEI